MFTFSKRHGDDDELMIPVFWPELGLFLFSSHVFSPPVSYRTELKTKIYKILRNNKGKKC